MKRVVAEALVATLLLTGWAICDIHFREGADAKWYEGLTAVITAGIAALLGFRWGKFLRVKRSAKELKKLTNGQAFAVAAGIGVPVAVFSMYLLTSLFGLPNFPAHVFSLFGLLVVMIGILAARDYL